MVQETVTLGTPELPGQLTQTVQIPFVEYTFTLEKRRIRISMRTIFLKISAVL
jgi:hypothetical protein